MRTVTLTPAYGRDYTSKAKALSDWNGDKDFIINDIASRWDGKPTNRSQMAGSCYDKAMIRYKKNTQVFVVSL